MPPHALNNHLRDTLAAQSLTRRKLLLFQTSKRIECRGNQQHNSGCDQTCRVADERKPLDYAHCGVDGGAHVVGFEAADEGVEFLGGRADAQEEGDFDEDEDEAGDAVWGRSAGLLRLGSIRLGDCSQAQDAPEDDDVKVEDVGNAEGKAEDYAKHAGPGEVVSECAADKNARQMRARTIGRIYLWQWMLAAAVHAQGEDVRMSRTEVPRPEFFGERHVRRVCGLVCFGRFLGVYRAAMKRPRKS